MNCENCGLDKNCKTPRMKVTGEGQKQVLIIGEAPGMSEDLSGVQFCGEAGKVFRSYLSKYEFDMDQDAWKINAVNCRPPNNRKPKTKEIRSCRPYIEEIIKEFKPKHIWLVGGAACESFFNGIFEKKGINAWRDHCIPDQVYKAWVTPLFHPSFIMRNKDKNLDSVFDRGIQKAISNLSLPDVEVGSNPLVNKLFDYPTIWLNLSWLIEHPPAELYIDYETTGLKPFSPGHKVVSISYCTCKDFSYSFPLSYRNLFTEQEQNNIIELWNKIISNPKTKVQGQNIKFEDNWSRVIFKSENINWDFDTQLAAHILDSREGQASLKFQTYYTFGIHPYDNHIKPYLQSDTSHGINRVDEIELNDLLHYNGLDTLYGFRIKDIQKEKLSKVDGFWDAYNFFHEGNLALADIQLNGICINQEYYKQQDVELEKRIEDLKNELLSSEEAKEYLTVKGKEINLKSTKQLGTLFFEMMELDPVLTAKGNYSTSRKALEEIEKTGFDFVTKLVKLRKLEKIKNTYLSQYLREGFNGKINPFFDLHTASTYRSSCSSPNMQNIPVREEEAKKICRDGVIPTLGNEILEADFKSIEVCISACYNRDPNLIKYVSDPKSDMHRDTALDLFLLTPEEISKELRFYAKNMWVFAQFYGSYYVHCAENIWKNCLEVKTATGITLKEHLSNNKINNLEEFTAHCEKVEHKFWRVRFPVYRQWRFDINDFYIQNGFVPTYLGFRCGGYLVRNNTSNSQIQGTAFHILLWTLTKLNDMIKLKGFQSKIIGQIHDSILIDLVPAEKEEIIKLIIDIATKRTLKKFKWIITPLAVEFEATGINQSWCSKKEIKV